MKMVTSGAAASLVSHNYKVFEKGYICYGLSILPRMYYEEEEGQKMRGILEAKK